MTREEAILKIGDLGCYARANGWDYDYTQAVNMAIKSLQAWDKFKQALDKRILEQGFDEDDWSVSYNELIKMMKKCGGVE